MQSEKNPVFNNDSWKRKFDKEYQSKGRKFNFNNSY